MNIDHDPSAHYRATSAHRQRAEALGLSQRQAGRRVDNLPLYWVRSWKTDGDETRLRVQTGCTDYETYLAAAADEAVLSLTVCAALRTPDGIVLERRSQEVAEGSGLLHVKPSGHVHPPEEPWNSLLRETAEELGLRSEEVRTGRFLGLVRSHVVACASLVFTLDTEVSFQAICQRHKDDAWEAEQLFCVDASAAGLRAWLEQHDGECTSIGLECLLAAGASWHGDDWLEGSPLLPPAIHEI